MKRNTLQSMYQSVSILFVFVFLRIQASVYYSICKTNRDMYVGQDIIRVGSGESENQTGYEANLDCSRVVLSPRGWRIGVRFIRRDLEHGDYIRLYDGGYLASHVSKVNAVDTGSCDECPEAKPKAKTTGNALLVRFITNNRPTSHKGFLIELSATPPSPGCKCPAVVNGQMSCNFHGAWHDSRDKRCNLQCNPGTRLIDNGVFAIFGANSRCDVDKGKWNFGADVEDVAFCQNTSTPNSAEVQYSYYYKNISCHAIDTWRDTLLGHFELFIKSNSSLPQNGVCFNTNSSIQAHCSVKRLALVCFEQRNKTSVTVTVRDVTKAARRSNATAKAAQFRTLISARDGFTHLRHLFNFHLLQKGKLDVRSSNVTYKAAVESIAQGSRSTLAYGTCDPPNVYVRLPDYLCAVCPQGYQHTFKHFFQCSKCPKGSPCYWESKVNGTHSNCNLTCPLGKGYNDTLGFCEWCPNNSYQDLSHALTPSCIPCPESKITTQVGAKNVSECIDRCRNGTYLSLKHYIPGTCVRCPKDTYMDKDSHDNRDCYPCGNGKMTLRNGSSSAHDCVERCLPGHFLDTTTRMCQPCAKDFYQEGRGQTQCTPCQGGQVTLSNGTANQTGCLTPCSNGTYMFVTGLLHGYCVNCPLDTYMDQQRHILRHCKPCGNGRMTLRNGSMSVNDCYERCSSGKYLDLKARACKLCRKNSFQEKSGQLTCVPCPKDHMTSSNGTSNSSECIRTCPIGSFVASPGLPLNCSKCPRGTYQDTLGEPSCKTCPDGKGTLYAGTNNITGCVASCSFGAHVDPVNPGTCVKCPLGSYQDKNATFDGTCTKCPDPKTTTFGMGARNASACVGYCSSSPCFHGGSCVNVNGTFRCDCSRGLGGRVCEDILDGLVAENMTISLTFTSLVWYPALLDVSSIEFHATAGKIESSIQNILKSDPNFRTAKVRELRNGSVVATIDITNVAENTTVGNLAALDEAVKNGKVGELLVKSDSLSLLSYSCGQPLGMQDMRIADDQISASTYKDFNGSRPWDGRLRPSDGSRIEYSWEAHTLDQNQYLQVDFRGRVRVTAVATQGKRFTRYVKTYKLSFSDDGKKWTVYHNKTLAGNTEPYNTVKNTLPSPIDTRYIRLHPVTWKDDISMTMEVYGCISPVMSTPPTKPPAVTTQTMTPSPMTSQNVTSSPTTSQNVTSSSMTSSPLTPTQPDDTDSGGLSSGAIAAICVVCVVVAIVILVAGVVCYRKRQSVQGDGGDRKGRYPVTVVQNPSYEALDEDKGLFTSRL